MKYIVRVLLKLFRRKVILLWLISVILLYSAYSATRTSSQTGNWNQPSTWNCSCVPASTDSAVISNGTTVNLTDNRSIAGLTIQNNGTLSYGNGVTLSLTKDFIIDNGGTLNGSGNANNILKFTAKNLKFTVNGTAAVNKLVMDAGSNSDLYFYGSGTLTINSDIEGVGANPKMYNRISGGGINVNGNIKEINNNFLWTNCDNYSILRIGGEFFITGLITWSEKNTIEYNGSGPQIVLGDNMQNKHYGNLILSGSGVKSLKEYVTIYGDLTIENCTLDVTASNNNIKVSGNWINNGGTFIERNGTVTFSYYRSQSILNSYGNETFYNLTIDKSYIDPYPYIDNDVTVNNNITVTNQLALIDGKIFTASDKLLILETTGSVIGGNDTNFINGPMQKKISTIATFVFPVGKSSNYQPIGIQTQSADTTTFTAEYFNFNQTYGTNLGAGLDHISQLEHWFLDRSATGIPAAARVVLYWNEYSALETGKLSDIRVARWNGSQWVDNGNFSVLGNETSGNITSFVVTAFSPFTLASATLSNPLPIELLNFYAKCENSIAKIRWTTVSETNNDYFTVEKATPYDSSQSGELDFTTVGTVKGAGNSSLIKNYEFIDANPIPTESSGHGLLYYRIRQTDFDGAYHYSEIITVKCSEPVQDIVNLFVNDQGEILIIFYSQSDSKVYQTKIYNASGKQIINTKLSVEKGSNAFKINIIEFTVGVYLVIVQSEDNMFTKKAIFH